MTAFSDFPAPAEHPLHPAAEQIHAYLEAYARAFGVVDRIRFGTRGRARAARAGRVDGEPFDAVVVASGRFRKPRLPPAVVGGFRGELIHAFDYPGAEPFARPRRRWSTATASAGSRSRPTSRRTRRSSRPSASRAT